jgi:arylsulfatase
LTRQPNIIFITVDQLAADILHCYGGSVDSSPTLDSLAERGRRFDRCYAHSPLCSPNRATMLTGRSIDHHGITQNNLVLPGDNPTYGHVLQHNGYRTGAFGKFHQTPMQQPLPDDFSYLGFDDSVPTEDSKLGPWLDWIEKEHPEHYETALAMSWPFPYLGKYGSEQKNLKGIWQRAHDEKVKPQKEASEWSLMYSSPLPKELHQTTYITDLSLDFMQRHIDAHSDQPFLCHVSYVDPHDPYDPPAPYDTMFDPDDMDDPIPMTQDRYECERLETARNFHNFRTVYDDKEAIRKLRALYHGSVRFIDDQLKRITDWVKTQGLSENTVIVFTSDHGDMLGDHGFITKGVMHYDKSIRCPLIVKGPTIEKGITKRLTSSLDFFPTFCDWANVKTRPPLEGKSFAGDLVGEDEVDSWTEVTVQVDKARSIVTEDGWRLTIYNGEGYGEMFNLLIDPNEQRNIYNDSAWNEKKIELMERHMQAYMRQTSIPQYRNLPTIDGVRRLFE